MIRDDDPRLFLSPAELRNLSGPAWRTLHRIAEEWQLTSAESAAIVGVDAASWALRSEVVLEPYQMERASLLFGIYHALHDLLGGRPDYMAAWLRTANDGLSGRVPLDMMSDASGAGLWQVRRYLAGHLWWSR